MTSFVIPTDVLKRARLMGINVSGTARVAVIAAVEKAEKEYAQSRNLPQNQTQSNPNKEHVNVKLRS